MKHGNFSHVCVFLLIINSLHCVTSDAGTENKTCGESGSLSVPMGLVLDLNSPLEAMAKLCIDMAASDFYEAHPEYTTRLQLHTKDVRSLVDANFAALELVDGEEVKGIIGPQGSAEAALLAELGQKVHVPIISFISQSSSVSLQNRYYVRTTQDDAIQAKALAAICQKFQWPEVALFYEDSSYGYQFLSNINKALQAVEIKLAYTISIHAVANTSDILKELKKVATRQTTIFLVHLSPSLGFQLFTLAKEARVMSEGYAWIVSSSLSNFMNSLSAVVRDTMEGVIGIRPYVNNSEELENFQERFKRNVILKNRTSRVMELNIYGLWAYDIVTALATTIERIAVANITLFDKSTIKNGLNKRTLRISAVGHKLLDELSSTKFNGLSGDFQLINGKLKVPGFEIFNVFGTGEKTIGFWTQNRGIIREWGSTGETRELKNVIWPGDSTKQPKGFPTNLRVGIPLKPGGFREFVNVIAGPMRRDINPTGFSIDIFLATLDHLPFPVTYEFQNYSETQNPNWSYDSMLKEIPQKFDMVVGDTTIWAPRAEYVDFSLPYSESGVTLVVKNKKPVDMWIFVRPLKWDLWLAIFVACLSMGIILRMLEHNNANNRLDSTVAHNKRTGTSYCFPIAVLAFPERNMISSNWSFFMLIFWLFMASILMQSYTANLSAILTLDQLKFEFSDDYYIGWQEGSFIKEFLTKHLHISEARLKSYSTMEEFDRAMSLGSKKGGIDAIFDEIPYMKLFVNKYDSRYQMVGPTYITGGFGFAFPVGSRLVAHFSKAIVDVTQGPNMTGLIQKNFGPGYSSLDPLSMKISKQTPSLTFYDFAGLFIIIGSVTMLAVLFLIWRNESNKTRHLFRNILDLCKFSNENSMRNVSDDNGDSTQGSGEADHEHIVGNNISSSPREGTEMLYVEVVTQGEHEPCETSLHGETQTGAAQN